MDNLELADLYLIKRLNGVYSEVPAEIAGLAVGKSGSLNFASSNDFGVKSQNSGIGSVILGGASNSAFDPFSVIVGGIYNKSSGVFSSIGVGQVNNNLTTGSTIFGGALNKVDNFRLDPFLQGPFSPTYKYIDNNRSTILGGELNFTTSHAGFIGGGQQNDTMGDFSVVGGGKENRVGREGQEANGGPSFVTIFGGSNRIGQYTISSNKCGQGSAIIGTQNGIVPNNSIIIGNQNTSWLGNFSSMAGSSNTINSNYSTDSGSHSTIFGKNNTVIGTGSTILGIGNITSSSYSSSLGGLSNQIQKDYSVIFGGRDSYSSSNIGYIVGGTENNILSNHHGAAIITDNNDAYTNPSKTSMGPNTFTVSFKSGIYLKNNLFFKRINPIESADSIIRASGFFV